ncbi:hypothetical protein LINGRAHAP2_LOCUS31247 [Linum grandiflorum]
MHCCLCS